LSFQTWITHADHDNFTNADILPEAIFLLSTLFCARSISHDSYRVQLTKWFSTSGWSICLHQNASPDIRKISVCTCVLYL